MKFIKWFFLGSNSSIEFPVGFKVSAPPFFLLIAFAVFVVSIIWVYRDASKRGKNGFLAGLFSVVAVWPLSLVWWLWLRPPPLGGK